MHRCYCTILYLIMRRCYAILSIHSVINSLSCVILILTDYSLSKGSSLFGNKSSVPQRDIAFADKATSL